MSAAVEIAATMIGRMSALRSQTDAVCEALSRDEWLVALRWMGDIGDNFSALAADAVQEAYNDGATKKAIAEALGVPASTFRGMEKTR